MRSEANTRLGAPLHGRSGPLHVEDRVYTHELSQAFVQSAVSAGLKPNDDFNGAEQEGAGLYQVTCKGGRRWSTNEAYLKPARSAAATSPSPPVRSRRGSRSPGRPRDGGDLPAGRRRAHGDGPTGGAPLRRRDQQPAPADAVRHRPVGPPGRARHRRQGRARGSRRQPAGPHAGAAALVHPRHAPTSASSTTCATSPAGSSAAPARSPPTSPRPAPSSASREGLPAPDLQIHVAPSGFYDNGFHEPTSRMFTAAPGLVSVQSRGSIRLRSADPTLAPGHRPGLPRGPDRPGRAARRHAADLGDLHPGCAGGVPRPALADAGLPDRRRPARSDPDLGADDLPPDLDLRDGHRRGRGGRPRAPGARRRRAARRRRLGDARRTPRQHQRPHHHGRREGVRPDQERLDDPCRQRCRDACDVRVAQPDHRRRRRHAPGAQRARKCRPRSTAPTTRRRGGRR